MSAPSLYRNTGRRALPPYEPTPKEIAERAAEIRATWDEVEKLRS